MRFSVFVCLQAQLDEALPSLYAAQQALKVLKKSHIVEVKSMAKPPPGVILTMEAVCIMMGVQPNKVGPAGREIGCFIISREVVHSGGCAGEAGYRG